MPSNIVFLVKSIAIAAFVDGLTLAQATPYHRASVAERPSAAAHDFNAPETVAAVPATFEPAKLTPDDLIDIHMINARLGWGVLHRQSGGDSIVHTADGGRSWYTVSPKGLKLAMVSGIDVVNVNTVWFTVQPLVQSRSSSGSTYKPVLILFHTEDGGHVWQSTNIHLSSSTPVYRTEISVIDARDSKVIFVDVIPQHGMSSMPGQLMVSHNGGKSWRMVRTANDIPLGGDLQFTTETTGWLSTADCSTCDRQLFMTTDGGESWAEVHVPVPKQFAGDQISLSLPNFSVTNPNHGSLVAAFQNPGSVREQRAMYLTENAGKSWTYVGTMPGQAGLVSFPSPDVGVVIPLSMQKSFPYLYETTDGGRIWSRLRLPRTPFATLLQHYIPSQLDFVSKEIGWIVWTPRRGGTATNQVWETVDGGHSWTKVWS